jgi:hypothetical protein
MEDQVVKVILKIFTEKVRDAETTFEIVCNSFKRNKATSHCLKKSCSPDKVNKLSRVDACVIGVLKRFKY